MNHWQIRFYFGVAVLLFTAEAWSQYEVTTTFIPHGITDRTGGYRPLRAELDQGAEIVSIAPDGLADPKFGWLEIGDRKFAVILDEPEEADASLFVDVNADGDLTNDPKGVWEAEERNELKVYRGECDVEIAPGQIGRVVFYRFDPNDPSRQALANTLMYYTDFGFEFAFQLDGQEFKTFSGELLTDKATLRIDRNGDGKFSRNYETVALGEPFNYTGTTHVFERVEGKLTLKASEIELAQLPLPPNLTVGRPVLSFTATAMDGTSIRFPQDYSGKLVMLDFWATWCGPCIREIPHMKECYEAWRDDDFEILGISLDRDEMAEKVTAFCEKRELPWRQIYEGKGWKTELGKLYDVSGIPFVLLVDGDSGEILATARELRGAGLKDFVGEQLERRKPK